MTSSPPFDDPEQVVRALSQQETVCTDEVARTLAQLGELKVFGKGDIIARQGDLGTELFYILSGSISIVVNEHEYRLRHRNEMVGEMAVMEPGERRSADLIANEPDTIVLAIPASAFHEAATKHGAVWECIARVLAARLRQRDELFLPPNPEPVVFIASSSEGLAILQKAESSLAAPGRELRPWNKAGIFRPTLGTLEELERHSHEVDFAVIIVTSDDLRESRGTVTFVPRDNVMLEFGLFMGGLNRERAFLLARADPDMALASDLKGVTVLYFDSDDELQDRLQEIDEAITRLGRMFRYCKVLG